MARSAWLAIGAVVGALALDALPPVTLALFAMALGCIAGGLRLAGLREAGRRLAPIAIGVLAIGLRGLDAGQAGTTTGPLPAGDGPWIGVVETVGAPRAGSRPATIRLAGEPSGDGMPAVLVAATLP